MDKKGVSFLMSNVVFLIFFIVFFMFSFWFVSGYKNNAVILEDFYAKQFVAMINQAEPGTEMKIDVTKISEIAVKNGKKVSDIVKIDDVNNEVIVSLRNGRGTAYKFFNDVDVVDWKVEQISGRADANRFIFKVVEKRRQDVQA